MCAPAQLPPPSAPASAAHPASHCLLSSLTTHYASAHPPEATSQHRRQRRRKLYRGRHSLPLLRRFSAGLRCCVFSNSALSVSMRTSGVKLPRTVYRLDAALSVWMVVQPVLPAVPPSHVTLRGQFHPCRSRNQPRFHARCPPGGPAAEMHLLRQMSCAVCAHSDQPVLCYRIRTGAVGVKLQSRASSRRVRGI